MNITRTVVDDIAEVAVEGRIDGYWADDLDEAIAALIREGHHRIRLNLALVTLITSAGIGVIARYYKQLGQIDGSLRVSSPSPNVRRVLEITKLGPMLLAPDPVEDLAAPTTRPARRVERSGLTLDVFDLDVGSPLTCRSVGTDGPLRRTEFNENHCVSLGSTLPLFALGVGAFGESFADCQPRFGELLSVCGATAHQPADGTNVPDYLVASGLLAPDVRVLYCLTCEGQFSHLLRFDTAPQGAGSVGLVNLLDGCLEIASSSAIGMVIVAETAGLVGAALRRSPALSNGDTDFFTHPGVRTRLTFTAERAFARTMVLAAGVAARTDGATERPQLRPLGSTGLLGHVHAAAFPFHPLGKGRIDLKETVSSLFESERLLGVLHLIHDDRGASGAGESEFIRGACWIGGLSADPTAHRR